MVNLLFNKGSPILPQATIIIKSSIMKKFLFGFGFGIGLCGAFSEHFGLALVVGFAFMLPYIIEKSKYQEGIDDINE